MSQQQQQQQQCDMMMICTSVHSNGKCTRVDKLNGRARLVAFPSSCNRAGWKVTHQASQYIFLMHQYWTSSYTAFHIANRQACSSQYLSNSTKITTNTETAMLSNVRANPCPKVSLFNFITLPFSVNIFQKNYQNHDFCQLQIHRGVCGC